MKKQNRLKVNAVIGLFALILFSGLASCGDDDVANPSAFSIDGTLNLPFAANGKLWAVLVDNDFDGDNGYVKMNSGTCGAGLSVPYTVNGVPEGRYYVYAVVFVVGNTSQGPQPGDLIGIYGGQYPDNAPATPNADISSSGQKFDIDLVVM